MSTSAHGPPHDVEHAASKPEQDNSRRNLAPSPTPSRYMNDAEFHFRDGEGFRHAMAVDAHLVGQFWRRFRGVGRWVPWGTSVRNIILHSPLNVLWLAIPFAWAAHFTKSWNTNITFALCFLALIPLEQNFDFLGEQMQYYLGMILGDLLAITLNNAVEATLAIVLLARCDLRLLQATLAGVVLLHLLLVPGMAFLTGGARILEQNLHAHQTQLNLSLLSIGVLALLLPTAFFSALDRGSTEPGTTGLISDGMRGDFLSMSRGIAVVLLVIYVASRLYIQNPPGESNALMLQNAPKEIKHEEHHLATATPKVNVWVAIIFTLLTVGIMAFTAEMLVESIEYVREAGNIGEEWFGLVLLPIVSFAADGTVATIFFARYTLKGFLGTPEPPTQLAKGRAIDLSIQFTLFWLPFLVLLGWWIGRPLHMLFDYYEVALLLGASFLVNYVTADAKTNWVEGLVLVGFYIMIATVTWYYPGQEAAAIMLRCASVLVGNEGHEE